MVSVAGAAVKIAADEIVRCGNWVRSRRDFDWARPAQEVCAGARLRTAWMRDLRRTTSSSGLWGWDTSNAPWTGTVVNCFGGLLPRWSASVDVQNANSDGPDTAELVTAILRWRV